MAKYCFVLPRVGEHNIGGAEFLSAMLAKKLSQRGDQVEILSTCAKDNRSWENHFPEGATTEFGIPVRRYAVDQRDLDAWVPLQIAIHNNQKLSIEQQIEWMKHSVNSCGLYSVIAAEKDRFDAIFFAPYLFGTTVHGSLICPEKSVLIPCLHDESYAYTEIIAHMFRKVAGCLFNARAERNLAERLYGPLKGGVVGMGFDVETFKQAVDCVLPAGLESTDYILYLGRKETGKNADLLVKLFLKAKDSEKLTNLKLVIAGGGSFSDLHINRSHPDVIDLSHVSEEQKIALIRKSKFLCQPSVNESFSIVLMEAWMQNIPVLVNSFCDVTKEHVELSNAGLYFADYADFVACCEFFIANPEKARKMGESGSLYVEQNYSWESILDRFDSSMIDIFAG